jgi:tryptophan synthase alpha chain
MMHKLVAAGADLLELGVPFSDPMADGPVIQLACERALEHGTRLVDVLAMVVEFRKTNTTTPVVLMGYLNPVEVMGYESFAKAAGAAGVDGVLTVDLPPEESENFVRLLKQNALDAIYLIAPTTTDERIKKICEYSSGYVYYVSVKGVTGSAALDVDEVASKVARIREISDIAVGVGFGISDGESASQVSRVSDGVIVGSVLVNKIAENDDAEVAGDEMAILIKQMRDAMDA